jgi:hypothetical protein
MLDAQDVAPGDHTLCPCLPLHIGPQPWATQYELFWFGVELCRPEVFSAAPLQSTS